MRWRGRGLVEFTATFLILFSWNAVWATTPAEGPLPDFKLPLPADELWRLNTEMGTKGKPQCPDGIGGTFYNGTPDCLHHKLGLYALDFSDYTLSNDKGIGVVSEREIRAAATGTVTFIKNDAPDNAPPIKDPPTECPARKLAFGNEVVITHGNFTTRYAHLKPGSVRVHSGHIVVQGQVLGIMGSTGCSTGSHLHFEVRYNRERDATTPPYTQDEIDELNRVRLEGKPFSEYIVGPANPIKEKGHYLSTNYTPSCALDPVTFGEILDNRLAQLRRQLTPVDLTKQGLIASILSFRAKTYDELYRSARKAQDIAILAFEYSQKALASKDRETACRQFERGNHFKKVMTDADSAATDYWLSRVTRISEVIRSISDGSKTAVIYGAEAGTGPIGPYAGIILELLYLPLDYANDSMMFGEEAAVRNLREQFNDAIVKTVLRAPLSSLGGQSISEWIGKGVVHEVGASRIYSLLDEIVQNPETEKEILRVLAFVAKEAASDRVGALGQKLITKLREAIGSPARPVQPFSTFPSRGAANVASSSTTSSNASRALASVSSVVTNLSTFTAKFPGGIPAGADNISIADAKGRPLAISRAETDSETMTVQILTPLLPGSLYHVQNIPGWDYDKFNWTFTTVFEPLHVGSIVQVSNTGGVGLNLRNSPEFFEDGRNVLQTLPEGTQLRIVEEDKQFDNGYRWWRVSGGFVDGWSAVGEWLRPTEPGGLSIGAKVTVDNTKGIGLHLRSEPGLEGEKLATLPEGTQLTIISGPIYLDGYLWWNVRGDAGIGWSAVAYWLTPVDDHGGGANAPIIAVGPGSSHDFGSVVVGSSSDTTYTVTNTGNGILSGTASINTPFSIVSGGTYNLSAGQSSTVVVRFSPIAVSPALSNVSFSGGGGDSRVVNGKGITSVSECRLSTLQQINFGDIALATSFDVNIPIQNQVGGPQASVSLSVTPGTLFSIITPSTLVIQPGQGPLVRVRFAPTLSGSVNGTLSIRSRECNLTVALSGNGRPQPGTRDLTLSTSGNGNGAFSTNPIGPSCGFDCQSFPTGTGVSLIATPAPGSVFVRWEGDPDCTDGQVTMTTPKTCFALFTSKAPVEKPDLTVLALTTPATAGVGENVSILVTVQNVGTGLAVVSGNGLYLSSDPTITTADTFLGQCYTAELPPGTSTQCRAYVDIPNRPGTLYIGAIADYANLIAESNESNNSLASSQLVTISTATGTGTIIVRETLNGEPISTFSSFTLTGPGDTFQGGDFPDTFGKVYSRKTAGPWTINNLRGPTATTATVSPSPTQTLLGGGTIIFTINFTTIGEALPDLMVDGANGPDEVRVGQQHVSLQESISVRNVGNASSGAFRVGFYWSQDLVLSADDVFAGSCVILGLGLSQTGRCGLEGSPVFLDVPGSLAPGKYFLITVADDNQQIPELNETNNWKADPLGTIIRGIPRAPGNLIAAPFAPGQAKLQWQDNSTNETGFRIERRTGSETFREVATVGPNTGQYTDKGLLDGQTYFFRVRAFNDLFSELGGSDYSMEASATLPALTSPPAAPTNLRARALVDRVLLSWDDPGNLEASFKLERKAGTASFIEIAQVDANVVAYVDAGRSPSTNYTYRLRGTNSLGDSPYSNEASVTTPAYAMEVYAVNNGGGTVSIIDANTNTSLGTVNAGPSPADVAFSPDRTRAYVTNALRHPGSITILDTVNRTVLDRIDLGTDPNNPDVGCPTPGHIAISLDGGRGYVTCDGGGYGHDSIGVVDISTWTIIGRIPIPDGPTSVAVSPDGKTVYATNANCGPGANCRLFVIDTATNSLRTSIEVQKEAGSLAVTPDGSKIYVSNINSNSISVIDAVTGTVIKTVPIPSEGRHFRVFMGDGKQAYVLVKASASVLVLDVASDTIISTIPLSGSLFDGAVAPDGSKLLITNLDPNSVIVFDMITSTAQTIPVGVSPLSVRVRAFVQNMAPVASAGIDQTVRSGSLVRLNAGGSVDPDNGPSPLGFSWTQTAGPPAGLTGTSSATPTFTPTVSGTYAFSVIASDGEGASQPSIVTITVPKLGDLDLDGDVDQNDVNLLRAAINQSANGRNDLRDINGDGVINAVDLRRIMTLCTRPRCATQ